MKKRRMLCYSLCLYTAFMQAPLVAASATWNGLVNTLWTNNSNWSAANPNGAGEVATFPGAVLSSVNVNTKRTVGQLTFTSSTSYSFTGAGPLSFDNAGIALITATSGGTNTCSTPIELANPLVHNQGSLGSFTFSGIISSLSISSPAYTLVGGGTVTFSAVNTYSQGTNISSGTLLLTGSGALNASGSVNLSSASSTFNISGITAVGTTIGDLLGVASSSVALGSKALTFGTATASATYAGIISGGGGSIRKQGTGTAILSGINTYTGGTTFLNGTLSVSADNNLGNATGGLTFSGGTLQTTASFASSRIGSITSTGTINTNSGVTTTLIGNIGGVGSLTKTGAGTLVLGGSNSYLGGTTISAGILQGDATSLQGNILDNSSLVFDQAVLGTYSGNISGSGTVSKISGGTLTFAGSNSYSGGTIINAGTLSLSSSGSLLSTGAVNVNSATSVFDISPTTTGTTIGNLSGIASSSVTLGSKTLTFGTATPSTPFAGNISGVGGSIIKQGSGTAILTGTNSYSGGTTISAGTLQGNATSLQGNILDNANLVFDQGGAGTYSGSITGTGTLVTQGAGPLNFAGASTLAGQVTVSSGTFLVNGSLAGGGPMTVSSGATLGGSGTITKDITIQGTLSPGNSIGTINLVGAQVLASGSMLDVEITPTTNDLVNVTGTMDIQPGATLRFIPTPGDYSSPFTHTLIQTTGGVTGTFTNVINTLPLFLGNVTYTATDVLLNLGILPLTTLVSTGKAGQVARCLDGFTPPAGSDLEAVINDLHFVTNAEELEKALLHMQPSQFTALALMQENNTLDVNSGLFSHMESLQPYCSPKKRGINVWVLPFGTRQTQSHYHQNPGYRATTPGLLLGMDGFATGSFLLGGFLGYSHSNLKWSEKFGFAHQDTGYASLYSKWGKRHAYLESSLIFGYTRYETNRHIFFAFDGELDRHAKGQHHGLQGSFHIKAAGDFERRKIILSPFAQASYIYLHESSFKEHGAQSLNLHVDNKNSNLLTSEAGLKLSHCFSPSRETVTPYIQGSAIYEARYRGLHEKAGFNGCRLDVRGLNPSRLLGSVEAGINSTLADQACGLSLFYQGRFGKRFVDNALYAHLNLNF